MTRVRVASTRPLGGAPEIAACVGDAAGVRRAWLAHGVPLSAGGECDVDDDALLPWRAGASDDEMLALVGRWPAWRLTQLARLELGSRLLVVGGSGLASGVLELARTWGCLWRAACGPPDPRDAADFWAERVDAEALARSLPAKPDAAILLGQDAGSIAPALAVCQDRGTVVLALSAPATIDLNLYPDAHRRGLRVVGCDPLTRRGVGDAEIGHAFDRIAALTAMGALPRG